MVDELVSALLTTRSSSLICETKAAPSSSSSQQELRLIHTVWVSVMKMFYGSCQAVSRWWKNIIDLEQIQNGSDSWILYQTSLLKAIHTGHHYSSPHAFSLQSFPVINPQSCYYYGPIFQQWKGDWGSSDLLNETLMDSCGKLLQRLIN